MQCYALALVLLLVPGSQPCHRRQLPFFAQPSFKLLCAVACGCRFCWKRGAAQGIAAAACLTAEGTTWQLAQKQVSSSGVQSHSTEPGPRFYVRLGLAQCRSHSCVTWTSHSALQMMGDALTWWHTACPSSAAYRSAETLRWCLPSTVTASLGGGQTQKMAFDFVQPDGARRSCTRSWRTAAWPSLWSWAMRLEAGGRLRLCG